MTGDHPIDIDDWERVADLRRELDTPINKIDIGLLMSGEADLDELFPSTPYMRILAADLSLHDAIRDVVDTFFDKDITLRSGVSLTRLWEELG